MHDSTTTALTILAALAIGLAVWIYRAWRATPYPFWQFLLNTVNSFFARIMWRCTVVGRIKLPRDQGAVIVSNHISGIDPLLIQLATDLRVVHWMVAREYFYMPLLAVIFKNMKSIPVNRGGIDTAATKMAIRYAVEGGLVGLFPEGRVNQTDELLLPGRPGAAMIALRARVPVIPVFVEGSPYDGTALGSFFMTGRARVTIGNPIDLSPYFGRENDRAALAELTLLFLQEIAKLAGREDFVPRLAGRSWKPETDAHDIEELNGRAETAHPRAPQAVGEG
ncbi:MAG: lysophospholipid acyltransferase family protein [Pirellulales bacterium]